MAERECQVRIVTRDGTHITKYYDTMEEATKGYKDIKLKAGSVKELIYMYIKERRH